MKAQVLTGIRQMELVDVARPVIEKDTDVLLKVEVIGVCGSDVHYYETGRIGSMVVQFPFKVGHECTATVEAVGSGVTRIKVGEQIVVDPAVSCYECDQCLSGRENTCRNLGFLGCPGQIEGCLSEYLVMPERSCYPTNGAITLEQGVLCEPFAIGVYAAGQSHLSAGAKIAVLGSGPIGLSCLAAAQAEGIEAAYVTDKIAERVEVAKGAGATWAGNPDNENIVEAISEREPGGMDVVFECAGQQETVDQGIELLRPGGRLMLIGIPREDRISFVIDKMRRKEIGVINVRRQNECTQAAIDLVASGKVDIDYMVTHRFGFDETKTAFDMVAGYRDGVVKALIELG